MFIFGPRSFLLQRSRSVPLGPRTRRRLDWFAGIPLTVMLIGCGGGGGSSTSTKSADDIDEASADTSSNAPESNTGDVEEGGSEPSGPDCTDETCFVCGSGLCPRGFYCDTAASGGPACGWLPECADVATCACVEKVLGSACSCDESDGGPHVTCE